MLGQACSSLRVSDPVVDWVRRNRAGVVASVYDSSDDSCSLIGDRAKRRKRTCSSVTTSAPEIEIRSDATLVYNMLEVADSLERLAVSAGGHGDSFARCLRENATKARASAVELAKRMDIGPAMAALERENFQLKERLLKVEQEMGNLRRSQHEKVNKEEDSYPKLPRVAPRATLRAVTKSGKSSGNSATEIGALTEQFKALGESEPTLVRTNRLMDSSEPIRPELVDSKRVVPLEGTEGHTVEPKQSAQGKEQEQHSVEVSECLIPKVNPATTWVEVVGRKEKAALKNADKTEGRKDAAPLVRRERDRQRPTPKGMRSGDKPNIYPPRRAAVAISIAPDSTKTCEGVLANARAQIRLSEIGGPVARIRQTAAGGILFEIPGKDRFEKADALAARLSEVFAKEKEVRISRPFRRAEIRILGLDMAIQPGDVQKAVVAACGCKAEEVKVGEIRKRSPREMGTAWVQCPASAAKVLVDQGKIVIGWVRARIEALRARPMTCYRCLREGHAASSCTSVKDRSGSCYNCGGMGHRAKDCRSPPKCLM